MTMTSFGWAPHVTHFGKQRYSDWEEESWKDEEDEEDEADRK